MPGDNTVVASGVPTVVKKRLEEAAVEYAETNPMSRSCYYRMWLRTISRLAAEGVTPEEHEYWVSLILDMRKVGISFEEIKANLNKIKKICLDDGD